MRKSSKLVSLLLVLCMVMALCTTAFAAEADGDIVVLYTNDVHCGIEDNIGYAGLAAYKAEMLEAGNYVALVDAGDAIQGAPIGSLTKGASPIEIMNQVGYDFQIPGNHEFDYGMTTFLDLSKVSDCGYYSCNFMDLTTNKTVFEPYKVMTFGETKVAFVGITTPEALIKSTPAYFQDSKGNYIYGFCEDETGAKLYAAVQTAVDAADAEADYVIAVAHTGNAGTTEQWTTNSIIANTTGIDVYIDGHSHETVAEALVENKDGEDVLLSSTGTKLSAIGKLTIADGKLHTELVTEYEAKDETVDTYVKGVTAKFDEMLSEVVAKSDVDLTILGADGKRAVRSAETNLGDLCADAYRSVLDADIAFVNGGGVRDNIAKGDITYGDIIKVHPFSNEACMIEVTGQQILDALEWGSRNCPEENGGFLQVSGLTYQINTYLPSSVVADEKGNFVEVDGDYRVSNVKIGGKKLKLDKTYTLASHNYMLLGGGDGYTMFKGAKVLKNSVMLDNQVLINYIKDELNGKVPTKYAKAQGRILVTNTPFDDVGDAWYTDAVKYVYENELMTGTSPHIFAPTTPMTRSMLVTMLYRLADSPEVDGKVSEVFADCKDDYWYSDAIVWASENKIVDGNGKGKFLPLDTLTREAMAKILYAYALYNGADEITAFAMDYKDVESIADWALPGVAYCTNEGILSGVGKGNFNAKGSATRAMGAQVLMTLDMAAKAE